MQEGSNKSEKLDYEDIKIAHNQAIKFYIKEFEKTNGRKPMRKELIQAVDDGKLTVPKHFIKDLKLSFWGIKERRT